MNKHLKQKLKDFVIFQSRLLLFYSNFKTIIQISLKTARCKNKESTTR